MSAAGSIPAPGLHRIMGHGIPIAVEVVGNGAPDGGTIAWLHGLGSSSIAAFAGAARHPALAGTTSLLIDLPGHGQSGKPAAWPYELEGHARAVNEVLATLVTGPVTVIGHSMGGTIAIACAEGAPEGLDRLILAQPSLKPGTGHLSAHIAAQPEARFVGRGHAALLRATERQAERGEVGARAFLPTLRQALPAALHRSAVSLVQVRSPSWRERLADLRMPRAMIMGDLTPPVEPSLAEDGIRGYVVPGAGHVLMADNPDGFARAVAAALAEGRDG